MRDINPKTLIGRLLPVAAGALASLFAAPAQASAPGITGAAGTPTFNLTAGPAYISQPDGASIYSWGYGCASAPSGYAPAAVGVGAGANCPAMQIPGPTLIVTQGDTVTVTLTNNLPARAGNTSILFPGFAVTAAAAAAQPAGCAATSPAPAGLLTTEAAPGCAVTYTFTATTPGTRSYYSGTQGDLQVEMGLFGAIIVLPNTALNTANCTGIGSDAVKSANGEGDFRLAPAAYDHASACYDREYLFQFSEMDPKIHSAAEAIANCVASPGGAGTPGLACAATMNGVQTELYHPAYFMINGRSMPDDMDPNYAFQYPHQPYNGNPHMHPGELTLLRIIGQGRWQHPFHEHGNHVRILARDGNLLVAKNDPKCAGKTGDAYLNCAAPAGPLMFTTTTTPGVSMDGIFYWTGKGLNWDAFGHTDDPSKPTAAATCIPDANGYYTMNSNPPAPASAPNYYEWCGDHNKALEKNPFGQVGGGGPITLPDPNVFTNGAWYGGSPYLGPDAMARAVGTTPIPPSGTVANSPTGEAGFAYMWHSHNEREITTNNIFPGGMLMMMLVDPRAFQIDESK